MVFCENKALYREPSSFPHQAFSQFKGLTDIEPETHHLKTATIAQIQKDLKWYVLTLLSCPRNSNDLDEFPYRTYK